MFGAIVGVARSARILKCFGPMENELSRHWLVNAKQCRARSRQIAKPLAPIEQNELDSRLESTSFNASLCFALTAHWFASIGLLYLAKDAFGKCGNCAICYYWPQHIIRLALHKKNKAICARKKPIIWLNLCDGKWFMQCEPLQSTIRSSKDVYNLTVNIFIYKTRLLPCVCQK